MRQRLWFAATGVDLIQHGLDFPASGFDRLARAAGILDGHGSKCRAFGQPVVLHDLLHLVRLAAQPDHQYAADIGVAGIALQGSREDVITLAPVVDAATAPVCQRDDAVDVGPLLQSASMAEMVGDVLRDSRRAIHRADDGDVVARPGASVRPRVPQELPAFRRRYRLDRPIVGTEIMASAAFAHRQIMQMHMIAGANGRRNDPDYLSIL